MKGIMKYIRPYWLFITVTLLIKFAATYVELLIPDLMEVMIDDKAAAGDLRQIYLYGGGMVLCAIGALVCNIVANRMTAVSSGKITKAIRHDLFVKLQSLSARQMDELTLPSAESRLTSDTYNVNQMLARVQRMGIRAPILLIGGIIMMLQMDATLALVLIALLPIIAVVVYFVTKYSVPMYTRQQTVLDKVVRVVQENITGIRVIKALSKTDYEKKRFHEVNNDLAQTGLKAGMITSVTNPTSTLILNLGLTLVVVVGAYRVNDGEIKSGVIIAFLQYFTMILNAMLGITRVFIMLSKGQASAKRVASVLELPEDLTVLPAQEAETDAPAHIEFRDVTFSYTGVGMNTQNLSFRLEHGQTLGILGPTGSGKSTILNLLLRLYDPDSGQVLIDGQDIRTIPTDTLRKKFGVVFQNDFVTEGTIGHNIRFFRELDGDDLDRAAEHAQAGFIAEKEGGMDAEVVVRGNNLSGGQKQRLLIARALAADPEILVLDDASSALDYQTDSRLRRALRENYRSTTTVVVAQRISSLRHADLILVLDEGQVIGAGNHDQLIATCEEYRIIAQTQMGDGKEGA
jgi:ATP-binding cassette subfamily B protein